MPITTEFSKKERTYTGTELRPHFLLTEMGIKGSAIGAFIGGCWVKTDSMVDWEDRMEGDYIQAKWMVHFIGEFFNMPLTQGVVMQRLIMALLAESLNEQTNNRVIRRGDDLFVEDRKLSVSIITASPVSCLLHVGINIDPTGAPVPAIGLQEMGIVPEQWIPKALERIAREWDEMDWACTKVRPVLSSHM
jgi:uncharacterized protein